MNDLKIITLSNKAYFSKEKYLLTAWQKQTMRQGGEKQTIISFDTLETLKPITELMSPD